MRIPIIHLVLILFIPCCKQQQQGETSVAGTPDSLNLDDISDNGEEVNLAELGERDLKDKAEKVRLIGSLGDQVREGGVGWQKDKLEKFFFLTLIMTRTGISFLTNCTVGGIS